MVDSISDVSQTLEFVHPRVTTGDISAINQKLFSDQDSSFTPKVLNPDQEFQVVVPLRSERAPGILLSQAVRQRSLPLTSHLEIAQMLASEVGRHYGQTGFVVLDLNQDNVSVEFSDNTPERVWITDYGQVGERGKGQRVKSLKGEVGYINGDYDMEELSVGSIVQNLKDVLIHPKGLSKEEVENLAGFVAKWDKEGKKTFSNLNHQLAGLLGEAQRH